jgi:hypothetical protein
MAGFTRNLKLRLSDDLTADARFNLERIDELGNVFPTGDSANQNINSSGDIRLNANAASLGGDGNGTVFAPNLQLTSTLNFESGPYNLIISPSPISSNITLLLPPNTGSTGQFLQTDGTGTLTWEDPPTSNFSSLNDTTFTSLVSGQIAQYNGSQWVNVTLPITRQGGIFDWDPVDGNTKTIVHNFDTTNIQVWIHEAESKSQVLIQGIDYLDSDTIFLTAHSSPDSQYKVHLIQTI